MRSEYESNIKLERVKRENTEQLNRSKLEFFTNISHEFRTPLTLILGPLEKMIYEGEIGTSLKNQLQLVAQNAFRLQRLVNQLLDFRKADSGSLTLQVAEGNFYEFLKEVKLSFESLAQEKSIGFEFKSSSNVIKAYYDRDQFEKIIFNLLSNAFKYTPEEGEIEMQLIEKEETLLIKVRNSGEGIKPADKDKIFQRFYSGNKTSSGTGIGLSLCKSLVELHHGNISVDSVEDEFTQFEVSVPLGSEHFSEDEIIHDFKDSDYIENYKQQLSNETFEFPDNQLSENLKDMKCMLIVDDNDQVRAFIKSIFKGKYILLEAANGKEAFGLAKEEIPDLIISDVMMPIMDGIAFCNAIKSEVSTSHIPVLLLTARTSLIYNVEGLKNGADDYITKPFSVDVLRYKVQSILKTRERLIQIIQSNNDLIIEPKKVAASSVDRLFISHTLEIIEQNMSDSDYSVVKFGKDVGLSRMQLFRKLKALSGLSPNEYIRIMRVKRAAQLLLQGDLNITEITYQVGFTDPKYFRKCFKQQFNETPSSFRKNQKKEPV